MSKDVGLSYQDLCELIAKNVRGTSASATSVDKYLKGIYKTILRQLELNKKVNFKNFGHFEIKERKGGEREIKIPSKRHKHITYVEPKFVITFKPSNVFDFCVNENDFKYDSRCETKTKKKKYKKRKQERTRKSHQVRSIYDLLNIANERKEWIERNDDNNG